MRRQFPRQFSGLIKGGSGVSDSSIENWRCMDVEKNLRQFSGDSNGGREVSKVDNSRE